MITSLQLIRYFEGFREQAYPDTNGTWTIGYGFTEKVIPQGVHPGDVMTREEAEALLSRLASEQEQGVRGLAMLLKPEQLAALTSLAYEVGFSAFQQSRCYAYMRQGNIASAMPEWLGFCHEIVSGEKRTNLGMVKRRAIEIAIYLGETFDFVKDAG